MNEKTYTVRQVAAKLCSSVDHVRCLIQNGTLKATKPDGKREYLIEEAELHRFLKENTDYDNGTVDYIMYRRINTKLQDLNVGIGQLESSIYYLTKEVERLKEIRRRILEGEVE